MTMSMVGSSPRPTIAAMAKDLIHRIRERWGGSGRESIPAPVGNHSVVDHRLEWDRSIPPHLRGNQRLLQGLRGHQRVIPAPAGEPNSELIAAV